MAEESASFDWLKPVRDHIASARNFDAFAFSAAKFAHTVESRMQELSLREAAQYIDCLAVKPSEYQALFGALFNDAKALSFGAPWDTVREQIIPLLISSPDQIRIWDAGCGTGLEAMLLCILMCEALGVAAFQQRVKIFATDISEEKLSVARQANYRRDVLQSVPPESINKYFVVTDDHAIFRSDLRRAIIYGKHDVLQDAPIARMDLIVCRYVLPFFDLDHQSRVLSRLKFACKEGRFLIAGLGELISKSSGFVDGGDSPVIFVRDAAGEQVLQHAALLSAVTQEARASLPLQESAFDSSPIAQLVIDTAGMVAMANAKARTTFGITGADFGLPLQDLEISYRPVELRSLIERARTEEGPVTARNVQRQGISGKLQVFDVQVKALYDMAMGLVGTTVQFVDISEFSLLRTELVSVNQQLQTANEELQSAHEELETTNEELQSSNEELETTNEELQSTNEELETINEELRSANSELEATNAEQRSLTGQIDSANQFLQAILFSIRAAVIVITTGFQVTVWNKRATELFGLRPEEVLQHNFFSLDCGLPVEQLKVPLREFIQQEKRCEQLVLPAINRRGEKFNCHIKLNPLSDGERGLLLVIEEEPVGGAQSPGGKQG